MNEYLSRVPPHDDVAERGVIGACLLKPEKIDELMDIIAAEDFYAPALGVLWRGLAWMREKGRAIDPVTLADLLRSHGHLDEIGGLEAINGLLDAAVTSALAVEHAQIVRDLARVRAGIGVCVQGLDRGYGDERGSADEYLSHLVSAAEHVAADRERSKLRPIAETISETMREVERQRADRSIVPGVPTGLPGLDRLLGGLHPGELTIVAGRPGMGKTALGLTVALAAAQRENATLVYSLEMRRGALERRLLSMAGEVNGARFLRPAELSDEDMVRIADAGPALAKLPIHIDDSEGATVPQLRARARRAVARLGIGLIVVDYLQCIQEHREKGARREESRERAVASMLGGMRGMARELEVPVMLLAQLNRQCEQRSDKRPVASDLRETGAAEQDADVILMLYRPSVYGENGCDEILIRKHRNGPCGTIEAHYQGEYTRWVEAAGARDGEPCNPRHPCEVDSEPIDGFWE